MLPYTMVRLVAARYGKENVRVLKKETDRESGVQSVTEMTVCCLLEGDIETSYTEADNSSVVATDSIKNTIYIKAKEFPVQPPELYASRLGQHFLDRYPHMTVANINVVVHRWIRISIDGKPHPHSFLRNGDDTWNVQARVSRQGIDLESSLANLLLLKSTGSQFHGFVRDEYTTLRETWDRILSTSADAVWKWRTLPNVAAVEERADMFREALHDARAITVQTFAEESSPSVQATMYKMCQKILDAVPEVVTVSYALPNKHYFEIDLAWHKGLKNTGEDAEVFAPQSGPNGLIKCEVSRE